MWGVVGEFDDAAAVAAAVRDLRHRGYQRLDAYTPHPDERVTEALGGRTRIGFSVLIGGLLGAAGGYALQWYLMTVDYPINVGGRPLHSWPAFIPVTFELMVLTASIVGVIALFVRNGLPRPHHPLFSVDAFARASQDRFFVAVEASDPRFSPAFTSALLLRLGAGHVHEVPDA